MKTVTFGVDGMVCGHCKASVEAAVTKVPGVCDAAADLDAKVVTVSCEDSTDEQLLRDAVVSVGFDLIG